MKYELYCPRCNETVRTNIDYIVPCYSCGGKLDIIKDDRKKEGG